MHRKLQDSREESTGQPKFTPIRNISLSNEASLNIAPYMGQLYHNDSYCNFNPFGGYLPGPLFPNTIRQLHLSNANQALAWANMGYQEPFFHIQNKVNSYLREETFSGQWNYVAWSPFWSQNFLAMPNNNSDPASDYTPYKEFWQEKPATLKDVHTKLLGKRAVQDIIPFSESLITSQEQTFGPHCKIKDLDQRLKFSSTEVKKETNMESEKVLDILGRRSSIVKQDKPLVTNKSNGRKNKEDQLYITCLDLNKPSKSLKSKKNSTEADISSEEEHTGWNGWQSGNSESTSPNPNGRHPSASVVSERSSTVSIQSTEGEFYIDSMSPLTTTQTVLSDKSINSSMTSSPDSWHSLSLATSTSDFVLKSQASSESNCEVREVSYQRSMTVRLPAPELSSKPIVLKPLPFIVEPRIKEDSWHIVRHKKKRKQHKTVTTKSYNSSLSQLSEHKVPCVPIKPQKKSRKRMKKNKFKYREPNKLEKAVSKEKVKPKCFIKSSDTTRKYNRQSSCDMFKEYLFSIIMWCRRTASRGELNKS